MAAPQVAKGKAGAPPTLGETTEELADYAVQSSPPWLISAVVHMVVLIVLALWMVVQEKPKNQVSLHAEMASENIDDELGFDPALGVETDQNDELLQITPQDLAKVDDPFATPPVAPYFDPTGTTMVPDVPAPTIGLALSGREPGSKENLLRAGGGTGATEEAVLRGLEWLARRQRPNGSWSLTGPYSDGAADDNPTAATAMALLAFQGAGNTHQKGRFMKNVAAGWKWLIKEQDDDGCFFREGYYQHRFYTQGQCTIAVCELYGMTKDETYKEPAERAIQYLVQTQGPDGGWRYKPQEAVSDVSVTGWIVMALQSARMAGLKVPQDTLRRVTQFLDSIAVENGTRYPYQKDGEPSLTMTAEALLCRQYLGWPRTEPHLVNGVKWITRPENLVNFNRGRNAYYWYYATQVCHHMEGEYWKRWNLVMREMVPQNQVKEGREAGSWDPLKPSRDEWEAHGGRLYVTCLSIYMLEVYYRHLPLYANPYHVTAPDPSPSEAAAPSSGDGDVAPREHEDRRQVGEKPKAD